MVDVPISHDDSRSYRTVESFETGWDQVAVDEDELSGCASAGTQIFTRCLEG